MSYPHLLKNFSIFTIIGGFFFVLAVVANAIAIDILVLDPAVATFSIMSVLFVAKYFVYLVARVIVTSFWRYTVANLIVTLLCTLTIWLLVDYSGLSGGLSTTISLGFFFFLRYVVLYCSGVIKREGHH